MLRTVGIYLGVPFTAGFLTRAFFLRTKGERWYRERFLPQVSPLTLTALLFTIVVMFSLKGDAILAQPFDVLRIAAPFAVYFALMFMAAFAVAYRAGANYQMSATLAFTAAGNNFELAIAVAVSVFGVKSLCRGIHRRVRSAVLRSRRGGRAFVTLRQR